jgi:predicted ATPase
MKYRVLASGLERIDQARKQKKWKRQDSSWLEAACVPVSTLKRFTAGDAISEDTFSGICKAVGIDDWQSIAEAVDSTVVPRQDWGNAPPLELEWYGRVDEQQTLSNWIVREQCRLVAINGLTGIGKTALIRHVAESLKDEFEFIIWRSFYPNAMSLQELVSDIMSFISNDKIAQHHSLNDLLKQCCSHRCLIILDDIQKILGTKQLVGKYQQQFKDYQSLFEQIVQSGKSCLIAIGNEQPTTISILKERKKSVRLLTLKGLSKDDSLQLLKSQNLSDLEGCNVLIRNYRGNPFFIKFISNKIRSLTGKDLSKYIDLKTNLIGGISEWLDNQFDRISGKEEQILYWLAILRFPVSFQTLLEEMQWRGTCEQIFNCLESLSNRSLIKM